MAIFLERIDSVPLQQDDFSSEYDSWVTNLVDTINENLATQQDYLNANFGPQPYTAAQITTMATSARDGVIWYCTDSIPPAYVGKISGALVQFTTAPFP